MKDLLNITLLVLGIVHMLLALYADLALDDVQRATYHIAWATIMYILGMSDRWVSR